VDESLGATFHVGRQGGELGSLYCRSRPTAGAQFWGVRSLLACAWFVFFSSTGPLCRIWQTLAGKGEWRRQGMGKWGADRPCRGHGPQVPSCLAAGGADGRLPLLGWLSSPAELE
jgi:hypothetical protein